MNVDAFELNKIAGGVLFALLVFFSVRTVSDIIFTVHAPETPGFDVAVTEEPAAGAGQTEQAAAVPLPELLQKASAEKGASQAKKCAACHTFEQGGANKVGPNLHGVIGRDIASHEGFAYSPALQDMQGAWDYAKLSEFIANPKGFAPGTKMAFAGIKNDGQRADLLLYLREQSPDAPPLPEAQASAPQQEQHGEPAQEQEAPKEPAAGAGAQEQPPAQAPQASQQPEATPAPQQPQASPQPNAAPAPQQPAQQ